MAIIGTTIRIQGVFTDLSGQAADLDDTPVLIIYDSNKNIVDGPLNCTRSEAGTYIIDYVVPEGDGTLFLEMSGMLEGNPIISRQEIEREWDDDDGQTKLSVSDVITSVDAVKPNAYTERQKTFWITEIDGKIAMEIHGQDEYTPGAKLLVPRPYSRLYELYVISQINFHDGEYDSFANSMVMFNSTLDDYAKHYHRTKIPARQTGFINVWG